MHRATLLALATITAVLSACGSTTLPPVVIQAKIIVSVTAPTQASVTLKGADGQTYPVSNDSVQVPAGTYTVTGTSYRQGAYTYAAASQTLTVKAGDAPKITVAYQAVTGALTLVVDDEAATVSGPDGYSKTFSQTGTSTLEDLKPGAYRVEGLSGTAITVNVVAGQTAQAKSSVIVTGALDFTAEVPGGITPDITLGGEGVSQALSTSGALHLAPGTYQISAKDVRANHFTSVPTPATQSVTVKQAARVSAGVKYQAVTGAATVNVLAVEGVKPSVMVSGPEGYSRSITATGDLTLDDLQPGEYTVAAERVTVNGHVYAPTLTHTTFTVTAGQVGQVGVSYGVVTGGVRIELGGLPEGHSGNVLIRNAQGYETQVSRSQDILALAPGEYNLEPVQIYANGEWFRAPAVNVTVVARKIEAAQVQYVQATGDITASVGGVPQDSPVMLHVTGPSSSTLINPGVPLKGLEPGPYTLTPQDVTGDGQRFGAEPQTVTVTAGGNATPSFTYAQETGSLKVEVSGLSGVDANVTVTAGGQSKALTGTSSLKGLDPGAFTVTAAAVHDLNFYYDPTVTGGAGRITAGGTTGVGVAYARRAVGITTDKTSLTLVAGSKADLTASVPGAFNQGVTWTQGSQVLGKSNTLAYTAPSEPGTYTLTAASDADPSKTASVSVTVLTVQQFGTSGFNDRPGIAMDTQGSVSTAYLSDSNMVMVRRPNGSTEGYNVRTALGFNPTAFVDVQAQDVAVDTAGKVYVVGSTYSTRPGNTDADDRDIFLVTFDAHSNVMTKQFGSANADFAHSVAVDGAGKVYIAGSTAGTFAGNTSAGSYDAFLATIDPNGTVTTTQFGTSGYDSATHVTVGAAGRVYLTGVTEGAFSGYTNAGSYDAFLAAIDSSGNVVTQQFGTSGFDYANGVAVDGAGRVYVAGTTPGAFAGNTNVGSYDAFLATVDANGTLTARQFGSSGYDEANKVTVDAAGRIYLVGSTEGTFAGNPNTGNRDIFLTTVNPNGEVMTRQFGSSKVDFDPNVMVGAAGEVYVAGSTYGTFAGNTSTGAVDIFLARFQP